MKSRGLAPASCEIAARHGAAARSEVPPRRRCAGQWQRLAPLPSVLSCSRTKNISSAPICELLPADFPVFYTLLYVA